MRQDVFAPQFDCPFPEEGVAPLEGWAYDFLPALAASSASSSSAVVAAAAGVVAVVAVVVVAAVAAAVDEGAFVAGLDL